MDEVIFYNRFHVFTCCNGAYEFDKTNKYLRHSSLVSNEHSNEVVEKRIPTISSQFIKENIKSVSSLIFEVTESCNLSCLYCGYGDNYRQATCRPLYRGLSMKWEIAKTVLDYYFAIWALNKPNKAIDIIFYGGEPLVNISLIKQIVSYIENNNPERILFKFFLTTNGLLLKQNSAFLVQKNFTISVSLDGDENADQYRVDKSGKASYARVMDGLRYIKKTYPTFFDSRISFQAVVTSKSSVLGVKRFFKEEFNKTPMIIELSRKSEEEHSKITNYYLNVSEDLSFAYSNQKKECEKYSIENPANEKFRFILMTFTDSYYRNYRDFLHETYKNKLSSGTCFPFQDKVLIAASGLLFQCEKTDFEVPLGEVKDGAVHVDDGYLSSLYTRLFGSFERSCISCVNRYSCKHCFYYDRDMGKQNQECSDYQSFEQVNIDDYLSFLRDHAKEFEEFIQSYQ